MAAAAFLTRRCGVAVWRMAATGSATLAIDALLSKSDLRRALKSSRGRSRNSAARRSSGATRAFTTGSGVSRWTMACTASSSCSIRLRLAILFTQLFTDLRPQRLQATELKLLHSALGALELMGDFADTFLLSKAHHDSAPLTCRKPVDKPEELRAVLDFLRTGIRRGLRRIVDAGKLFGGAA